LKSVVILNRPALDVIQEQDSPDTLFYLDPPYLHETRVTTGEYGDREMTRAMHVELLSRVTSLQGKVMLSAYAAPLYDEALLPHGWKYHDKNVPNNASHTRTKGREQELLWVNF
jgi:DNA adenine methylase